MCLPSYREGLPKVLLEAAACGKPIVATDVPGCREVVEPGMTGLLVPSHDAAALAEALRTLLADTALRDRMGQEARRRVAARFSLAAGAGRDARAVPQTGTVAGRLPDRAAPKLARRGSSTQRAALGPARDQGDRGIAQWR